MTPKIPGLSQLQNFTTKTPSKKMQCGKPEDGLKNDLIIRAARGQKTERVPVWVMRQAGRYLPEFRKLREEHEFFECCRNPELASEITLQPLRRYEGLLDAVVIFSDILVIPQAMGMTVEMHPGKGPVFPEPLQTPKDINKLEKVDVAKDLGYVLDAIRLTRRKLDGKVPIIGFCGAPWTLMAYMIEGGGSKTFEKAKRWLFDYPEESKRLLDRLASVCAEFLCAQIYAGAQLVQVFDSWAGELTPYDFRTFALPYARKVAVQVRDTISCASTVTPPLILFARGALGHSFPEISRAGYDVVGLDQSFEPCVARKMLDLSGTGGAQSAHTGLNGAGHRVALQGNLDPAILYAKPDVIIDRVDKMLRARRGGFGASGAYIANLGHGITPGVDPENLRVFLTAVKRISREIINEEDN